MTPPGIVAVPTGHQPRFNAFFASLARLAGALPKGSTVISTAGPDVTHNINRSIIRGLQAVPGAAWAWVIGDDHTFDPSIVDQLWASNVPVVVPFVLKRSAPHTSVLYHRPERGSEMENIAPDPHQRGLMQVDIAGGAGMLIRRDVLDVTGPPWFVNRGSERQGEDIAFCEKLMALNLPLFVNLDVQMGHITPVEIWPVLHPDLGWSVAVRNPASEDTL